MQYNGSDKWKQKVTELLNRGSAGGINGVCVNGESVVKDSIAYIIIPTLVSELDNDVKYISLEDAEKMLDDTIKVLQEQIEDKQPIIDGAASTITDENLPVMNVLVTNTGGKIDPKGSQVSRQELEALIGIESNIQDQLDEKLSTISGGASTIVDSDLKASRALVSDSSGKVVVSAVTSTELGYLDGVTSKIQTQLDGKASKSGWTTSRVMCSNSSGNLTPCNTTTTEIGYLEGVTSAIQTQLNGKAPKSHNSTETTYGVGSTTKYGHCMTINNLNTSSHVNGKALSAYQGYVLNNAKVGSYKDATFYKVNDLMTFVDSNNAIINGDKGMYIWGISSFSDARLKKNIKDSSVQGLAIVDSIKHREFDFVDEQYGQRRELGYVAQELIKIIPYLSKAVQELSSIVRCQQRQIDNLKTLYEGVGVNS